MVGHKVAAHRQRSILRAIVGRTVQLTVPVVIPPVDFEVLRKGSPLKYREPHLFYQPHV